MTGRAKAVSEEYKSALVDLTFNSKPMINLLTMLAEENNEYAQSIVNVICDRIKQVVNEQKMPALYLLDSILKNIGKEYMSIISKNIVDVFCCVFETAPDERKRMQLFKLRNTWNQYIPTKILYELDVRITRTDPNWPVAAPVVTSSTATTKQVIHVNPKFLKSTDPSTATTISASLAASIVAEKEASKLQNKITKQRQLEEEKRVQEQLRILQADKLKKDREQHELVLRQQQLERERLIAEQKRQLEVLRKQQQTMTDSPYAGAKKEGDNVKAPDKTTDDKTKTSVESKTKNNEVKNGVKPGKVKEEPPGMSTSDGKPRSIESSATTKVIPNIPPPIAAKDPRLKGEMLPNDPRVNRSKTKAKAAVNVMNKIVTNLSTKKAQPDDLPQHPPVRKIRPYVNPLYARSPVCIATASQSFASSSYSTLNLSVPKENVQCTLPSPTLTTSVCTNPKLIVSQSSKSTAVSLPSTSSSIVTIDPKRNHIKQEIPVCTVTPSHSNSIMQPSVSSHILLKPLAQTDVKDANSRKSTSSNVHSVSGSNVSSLATSEKKVVMNNTSSLDGSETSRKNMVSNVKGQSSLLSVTEKVKTTDLPPPAPAIKVEPGTESARPVSLLPMPTSEKKSFQLPTSSSKDSLPPTTCIVSATQPVTADITVKSEPLIVTTSTATTSSTDLPPPFSGAFKNLSSRDMQIAAQAAAIATAMHQMQSGGSAIAPEQSAQLAAQLIEIMQGVSKGVTTLPTAASVSTVDAVSTSPRTSVTSTVVTDKTKPDEKKKVPKENDKVREINRIIHMERSARSGSKQPEKDEHVTNKSKNENSNERELRSNDKIRARSPHDNKKETKHSRPSLDGRDIDKGKPSDRSLRSKTRERDKTPVILGEEPPSKKLKDSNELLERGRKARARSPSRYYNRMERKIESDKRVEEKGKELVLERIRKVSEGDTADQSKLDKEIGSSNKDRKSPIVMSKISEEGDLESKQKQFVSLKERLCNLNRKMEQTGTIDQDILTKIMAEVDHKAKDGVLLKDNVDELMWEIRHIRAGSKHLSQKSAPSVVKGKTDFIEPEIIPPNEHLHWRSRKDLADLGEAPIIGGHRPFERPIRPDYHNGPHFPPFQNDPNPRHGFDGSRAGHMNDGPPMRGPPPSHYMRDGSPHPSNVNDRNQPPYNSDGHMDGPYPQMDGPQPMHEPRLPHMEGPRHPPPHMMEGPRPPHHMLEGPRGPHHMMDGPRPPPHMMDGPRPPPHMMEGPRPPPHMMDGPRPPPHMMDGPRPPPHMMDGPRPPHMMDGPRPPHMMDGPRPPHMIDGIRPPHMEGPRPPHMDISQTHMDGVPRPGYMDGPIPPRMMHHMDGSQMQCMDGSQLQHRMDAPRPVNMMEEMRPRHPTDASQLPWNGMYQPHMDASRHPQMDSTRPPFINEAPRPPPPPVMEGPPSATQRMNVSQQMEIAQSYPQSQHSHMHQQNWGPNNSSMHQGHSYQNVPSQTWTASNLADSLQSLSSLMNLGGSGNAPSSTQPTFDVSSLLGQLTAAGLLPKSSEKKSEANETVEPPKEEVIPEIRLVLEDLRVRCKGVVNSLFKGMQCSSCGERFPSESLNQYRDHLDWHFRQNRKEKDGVRKGCRAWYFNLNDWVDQTIRIPEVAKVPTAPEVEAKDEEMEEVTSQENETPKLVEDNSIPVGETSGDICNVCMDALEQYWDEDREEWRYRKAVRENNKTYHYHCFVDYVPFEYDDECTPPETPSFPQSPSLVNFEHDGSIKEEMDIDVSTELDASTSFDESNINPNISTMDDRTSSTEGFKQSRLTTSMLEVLKTEDGVERKIVPSPMDVIVETDSKLVDNDAGTRGENKEYTVATESPMDSVTSNQISIASKTETDVISTLQDLLRVASTPKNTLSENIEQDKKNEINVTFLEKKENLDDVRKEVENLLSEMVDSVTNILSHEGTHCEAADLLPGANLSGITETRTTGDNNNNLKTDLSVIETEVITTEIGSWDLHAPRQVSELESTGDAESESLLGVECDKKEGDEEPEIAYSPYIENVDSPVYPVITTSNLACIEDEDSAYGFPFISFGDDDGVSVDPTVRHDVADTIDYLLEKVTVNSEGVTLASSDSLDTVEPSVRGLGSDLNISVNEVTNDSGVDG